MSKNKKQAEDLRPQLPWLSRIGTKNGELTSLGVLIRGAGGVLTLVNPVAAAVLWTELIILSRTKVKGRWLALGGGAGLIGALFTGWVAKYNTVWRDLTQGVESALRTRTMAPLQEAVSEWPSWILWQVPVAVCLGTLLCGLVLSYRQKYSATWREKRQVPKVRAVERARVKVEKTPTRIKPAKRADDIQVRFGVDLDTATPYVIPGSAFRLHSVVAGPSGFGKSTSIQRIIDGLVAEPAAQPAKVGVVMIDMKADPEMIQFLRSVATFAGRRFHLVTVDPSTSDKYNFLHHGDGATIKNKLIEAEANSADGGFSEPHYRRLGERYLLLCAKVLCELAASQALDTFDGVRRPWRKDMPDLVHLMNLSVLGQQGDRLSPSLARTLASYLLEVEENRRLKDDIYGIYNRYALMVDGPAGEIVVDDAAGLDMLDAMRRGDIVLFSLDATREAGTARQLGNLALQDVTYCIGQLGAEGYGKDGGMSFVCVDEFSALGGSLLMNLYARGRSAGAAVCLASQDLDGDLGAVSPEFQTQVLTNANVVILHQQRGESPDTWANAIGTREVWKETLQVTADLSVLGSQEAASGVGSLRQAHTFIVSPDTLRNLKQGEAITTIGHPTKTVARIAVSRPPERKAPTIPVPVSRVPERKKTESEVTSTPLVSTPVVNPWATAVNQVPVVEPENPWKRAAEVAPVMAATGYDDDPTGAPVIEPDE